MPALIQTIIAIVVLYIIFSIVNSVLIEAICRFWKTRATYLKNTLCNLFDEPSNQRDPKIAKGWFSFFPQLLIDLFESNEDKQKKMESNLFFKTHSQNVV